MAKQTHMQEVLVKLDVSLEQLQKGLGRLEGRLSGVMRPMMEAPTLREQSNGVYVALANQFQERVTRLEELVRQVESITEALEV